MRKLLSMMLATMMVLITSCVKDDMGIKNVEKNVKISISIPQSSVQSRAAYSEPSLDQNMRVYMYLMYDGKIVSKVADGVNHNFNNGNNFEEDIRVVTGKAYKLAVWADFGGTYYNVTGDIGGEPKVSMAKTTIPGSNNEYDAYFAIEDLNLTENNTVKVSLKRPFGLVKINTLDNEEPSIVEEFTPAYYSTTITNVPTSLNLLTGETGDPETVTINSKNSNIADFNTGELSFDYFFAGESQANLDDFTVKYSNSSNAEILSYNFTNIPVRRNYKTNVSGNILTKKGDVQVSIEQNWDDNINIKLVNPVQLQEVINEAVSSEAKDIVISVSETIESDDLTNNTLIMPQTDKNIVLDVPGISDGFTIKEVSTNYYTGKLTLKLPKDATTSVNNININLPNSTVTVENGTYTSLTTTTAKNTLIVSEGTTIESLTVNGGNVKIYGNVNSISNIGNGTIYRCLSTQKSLENLLSDTQSGYTNILIEVPAEIDGANINAGDAKSTLPKPVDIYADAKISNIIIDNKETAYSAMNVYDGAHTVVLNNVKMSSPKTDYSICKLLGSDLNFKAVGCEFILTLGKSNQSGLNIQNGGTDNVITAELDGCYIGFYSYDDRVNIDMDTDYDYPTDFRWSSYSRGITTGNNSNKTYDGTATTNLTIKNSFIEGAYYAINTLHNIKLNVDIDNSVLDGRAGFNIWTTSERPSFFNVKNSKFIGRNGFSGPTESFGTIVINGTNSNDPASNKNVRNINIVVDNSDIVSDNDPQTETNRQYIADIRTPEVASCNVKFTNGTTLREIKSPRLNYMVSMNYWNHNVVSADNTVTLTGKEGVILMPQKVWDGTRKTEPATTTLKDGTNSYTCYKIIEPSDLAWFADKVNSGDDAITDIDGLFFPIDIDLGGHEWTPIGCYGGDKSFKGLVVGNLSTISNLKIENATSEKAAGLFGVVNGTIMQLNIENASIKHIVNGNNGGVGVVAGSIYPNGSIEEVTVKNATIESNRWTGGIAGYIYGSVNDCEVKDITLTATPDELSGSFDNGDKVGGIVGYSAADNHGTISGNKANNVTIKGYRDLGGIIGAAAAENITDNSISNINITVDQKTGNYGEKDHNAGYIIGRILDSNSINESNTVNGNNSIETL